MRPKTGDTALRPTISKSPSMIRNNVKLIIKNFINLRVLFCRNFFFLKVCYNVLSVL